MDWSDVRTLKRSKGLSPAPAGTAGDEGAGSVWLVVVRRVFVTASLSLLIARHEVWSRPVWRAGGRARAGERCDPLARSGSGQARAAAVQSSAGRPAVRTRWLVILPSSASAASA